MVVMVETVYGMVTFRRAKQRVAPEGIGIVAVTVSVAPLSKVVIISGVAVSQAAVARVVLYSTLAMKPA